MDEREARRIDRFSQFALAALSEAIAQAGIEMSEGGAHEVAVVVGSGIGGIRTYTRENEVLVSRGARAVSPFLIPAITIDAPAVQDRSEDRREGSDSRGGYDLRHGADAIGQAFELIAVVTLGGTRRRLRGGGDADCGRRILAHARPLAQEQRPTGNGEQAVRRHEGRIVLAEGGALMVLEEAGIGRWRGGPGLSPRSSATRRLRMPSTSRRPMRAAPAPPSASCKALERAGLAAGEIGYVNSAWYRDPLRRHR